MDTTQTEATTEFVSGEEGQTDIIDQVVNESDGEAMQAEKLLSKKSIGKVRQRSFNQCMIDLMPRTVS